MLTRRKKEKRKKENRDEVGERREKAEIKRKTEWNRDGDLNSKKNYSCTHTYRERGRENDDA